MTAPPRVLIVEDDQAIASGLALNLRIEGYAPQTVGDGQKAIELMRTDPPDLVLLDISLPGKNGLEVLSELRGLKTKMTVPVIVLSARQEEFDKVAALRLGADDYVTKPFALAELLARVVAVLRRAGKAPEAATQPAQAAPARQLRFGDVTVDLDTRTVSRAGAPVDLTRLELDLLAYLATHPSKVFSREHLLREVWGLSHSGSKRTVDNFVAQLRAKLEADPENPRHLVTVRGSGYRFDP